MIETLTALNIKGACLFDEPLERHTTFNIGGSVKLWIEPQDIEDLRNALKEIKDSGLSWRVIGNGSNILASDNGLPDVVIKLTSLNRLNIDGYTIRAESGASLSRLVGLSVENSLSGLEFLTGIPGQVGGAIKGNAGSQGKSIDSVLKEACVMDTSGEIYNISRDEIPFGYRYSGFRDDTIILSGVFNLVQGDSNKMQDAVKGYLAKRREIFPTEPNAGCIFKNLPYMSAGRIIDNLGLKGFTIGKAMVSHRHANVIVNLGSATAMDVHSLITYVQDEVYRRVGERLELEIDCWGVV